MSEVTTRSRFFITAAVSRKRRRPSSSRVARSITREAPALRRAARRRALLQADQPRRPATPASGAKCGSGTERWRSSG